MPSLSSLIVQRQVATIAEVEQAIARQVIHGGDLVTNLLEVAPQSEHSLTRVLAESLGMPCVPPGRLPAPDNSVLDIVPVETALRYTVFPVRLLGKSLVLATSERLKASIEADLAYTLGYDVTQVAAPMIRIREGIAAHYGVPLEPRQLRLVQKLDAVPPAARTPASVVPPADTVPDPRAAADAFRFGNAEPSLPDPVSVLPSNLKSGVSSPPGPPDPPPSRRVSAMSVAIPQRPLPMIAEPHVYTPAPSASAFEAESDEAPGGKPDEVNEWEPGPATPEPAAEVATYVEELAAPSPSEPTAEAALEPASETLAEPREEAAHEELAPSPEAITAHPSVEPEASDRATDAGAAPSDAAPAEAGIDDAASTHAAAYEPPHEATAYEAAPHGEEHLDAEHAYGPPTESPPAPTVQEPQLLAEGPLHGQDSPRPPGMVDKRAIAQLLRRELGQRRKTAKTARKKGPFSRSDAERELDAARSPDEVLDTFFAFGSQFFEYAALFALHGDLVEGRDAWGPGADHLRVLGLGVPLDLPSSFATVRKEGHVLLSRFDQHDLDTELRRDLERTPSRASLAVLVPLTIKGRAVAMMYGDDGENDITLASLGDMLGFSALASAQLERIALLKKSKQGRFAGMAAPKAQPSSVAALARAFSLPTSAATTAERNNTPSSGTPAHLEPRVSPGATSVHPPAMPNAGPHYSEPVRAPRYSDASHPSDRVRASEPVRSAELNRFAPPPAPAVAFTHGEADDAEGAHRSEPPRLAAPEPERPAGALHKETRPYEPLLLEPLPAREERAHDHAPPPSVAGDPAREATSLHVAPIPAAALAPTRESPVERSPARTRPWSDLAADVAPPEAEPARPISEPPPTIEGSIPSSRAFVKPIPRTDEDDASALIAAHSDDEVVHFREEGESTAASGRLGSYHLVPRPADARTRNEHQDLDRLLTSALAGGLEGEEALSDLLRIADHDFPRMIARFPGPLAVDRVRARADLPPASECGPLLKVVVTMRRAALPFMTVRSSAPDVEQRFWATHALGELLFPEASSAILPRLFDDDVSVRRVARRAAQALVNAGAPGEPLLSSLDHTMRNTEEGMQRRLLAIEALSEVRVPAVVAVLIGALRDLSDAIVEAARTALMVVTRQDLGRNPDVWTAWWELHRGQHRIEWLIQALTHETPSIRRAAGDELKSITREYFGYYDDLPPRERERAQARYLEWWQEDGQYRFR